MKGAIVRMPKTNAIFKHPISKFFTFENTYLDTKQRDKKREQKLRREIAVIGELKMKYEC